MIVVDVTLRGRLLARYTGCDAVAALFGRDRDAAMVALAKHNLLKDRLVDVPHLDDLNFEVRDA